MLFIKDSCPVCRTGTLGLRRCADGQSFVVMCDECETVWKSPALMSTANALDAVSATFEVVELGVAIAGGSAAWAGPQEIFAKGWGEYVAGMQPMA